MKTIIAILFLSFSATMIGQTAKPLPKVVKQQAPARNQRKAEVKPVESVKPSESAKPVKKNPKMGQKVVTEAPKKVSKRIEEVN
jgi:hypothetical protein